MDLTGDINLVGWIAIWGLIAISAAVLGGVLAGIKNRDYSFWIAWCLVLPPLLILVAILPKRTGERLRRPSLDEQDRHW
ncbi:MAG: hypothetical protein V3V65_06740 [Hyphomicrobium sp.]